jgi:hypothetical protein
VASKAAISDAEPAGCVGKLVVCPVAKIKAPAKQLTIRTAVRARVMALFKLEVFGIYFNWLQTFPVGIWLLFDFIGSP